MLKLCVLVLALSAVGYCDPGCTLPPPQQVDWSKITGEWHEILNEDLPYDEDIMCLSTKISVDEEGVAVASKIKNKAGASETISDHLVKISSGYYVTVAHPNDIPEDVKREAIKSKIGKIENGEYEVPIDSYYTDYETYVMTLTCDQGRMDFWASARSFPATAADVLAVTNKLGELGHGWSELKLYLAKCPSK